MLERLYNSVSGFFGLLFDSTVTLLKVVLQSRLNVVAPPAQRPVCSVLGNGPSLRQSLDQHFDFIVGTETVAVNMFALAPEYVRLQPQNYVLLDPAFFIYTPQHPGHTTVGPTLDALLRSTTWSMNLYVPQRGRGSYFVQTITQQQPNINVVFFNYTIGRGFRGLRHWLYRRGWAMPQSQNVLAATLFLQINRGFKQILLFGADHSWHEEIRVSEAGQLELRQLHFYDQPGAVAHQPILDVRDGTYARMSTKFASLAKAFYSYEVLADYARSRDVAVLNTSAKSYIDAFPRLSIKEKDRPSA